MVKWISCGPPKAASQVRFLPVAPNQARVGWSAGRWSEAKTPEALHDASDQFFQWTPPEQVSAPPAAPQAPKPPAAPKPKQRPTSVVTAGKLLAADTPDERVHVSALNGSLRRTDSALPPQIFGPAGLVRMLKTYDLLDLGQEPGGHWRVAPTPASASMPSPTATE